MSDDPYPKKTQYPPEAPSPFELVGDEEHLHSVVLRGYRYLPALTAPIHENYHAHLTSRRMVLIPIAPDSRFPEESGATEAAESSEGGSNRTQPPVEIPVTPTDPVALPWNDIIEIRTAEGSRIPETLPGAEEHMLLMEARSKDAREFSEMFLFTVEPVSGALPAQRPAHGESFVARVEELLFEAFEP